MSHHSFTSCHAIILFIHLFFMPFIPFHLHDTHSFLHFMSFISCVHSCISFIHFIHILHFIFIHLHCIHIHVIHIHVIHLLNLLHSFHVATEDRPIFMRTGHTVVLSPGPVLIDGFRQGASKPGKERRKGRQGVTRVPELSRLAEADLREIRRGERMRYWRKEGR